jgi:predicted MPP superfamily phosphohydrolase
MRNAGTWWVIALIMLLIDIYVFQAIRAVSQPLSDRWRMVVAIVYWVISGLAIIALLLFPYLLGLQRSGFFRNYVFSIVAGLFFAKLVALLFFMADDIRRGAVWLMSRIFPSTGAQYVSADGGIPRSVFLSWLGLGVGGGLLGTFIYGFGNKYKYQIKRIRLSFPNLPAAFKGFKMVQISDVHSGSLEDHTAVARGVELILAQQPDVIVFTGDLVNDRALEMDELKQVFARLKAPMGVYSTLGNHDYGDYVPWPTAAEKQANLEALKQVHADMGWRLLMNEHVKLEKGGEQIAILGIENWGAKGRFPKYGKMAEAYAGTEQIPLKILLSHDPSHWDAEVRVKYPDIDLMLSGHTHGMQFGIENPYFKWSPVQWMYKQWAGLYEEGKQKLYVNRGFGFIGYPGRVGILPEITVFEFQ